MVGYGIYSYEGQNFHCGLKPRLHAGLFANYADLKPTYTQDQVLAAIKEGRASLADWVWVILDQGSEGDCWAYSEANCVMTKLNMLYGEQVLLDVSTAVVLTGQYNGGGIDSAIAQVWSSTGIPSAAFMGTDPTKAITKRSKKLWPAGWEKESALRVIPDGEWADSYDPLTLASAIIDGDPAVVGMYWQGNPRRGHALECVEVKTAAQLAADVEDSGRDELKRQLDTLTQTYDYRDESGELCQSAKCVDDLGSSTEFLFGGPNSWGPTASGGWGSYPGRPGWWLVSGSSSAMRPTFSPNSYGACILHGCRNMALPPAPKPQ